MRADIIIDETGPLSPQPPPRIPTMSNHYWTAKRLVGKAAELRAQGKDFEAQHLLNRIGQKDTIPQRSQRQRRKARREAWARGDRAAFAR